MRTLRLYVLREHLSPFVVTLGALTAVLLIGNIIKFAELVIAKGVSLVDLLRLLLYLIPYMLSFTVPMACLIAMVLAFNRLTADYELIAMRASGIAPVRLVVPMLVVGLLVSVFLLVLNDRIVPASHLAFRRQLKAIGVKAPTAYLEAGSFIRDFPPYVIFVYHIQGNALEHVRIYELQPNGPTRTIIADRGRFEPLDDKRGVRLKLVEGTVDEWDPARPGSFYKVAFTTYTLVLRTGAHQPKGMDKKLKELTFRQLLEEQERLTTEGVETLPVSLELHRKIASSFAAIVFVAFGLALGLRLAPSERLTSFVWILGLFMAYYLGTAGMNAVVLKGWLPAWVAMWSPNVAGAVVSSVMLLGAIRR